MYSGFQSGDGIYAMDLDVSSATYTSHPTPGFTANGQEIPRLFTYNSRLALFHMAHTNWQRHAPQPRPVTLWSVDPSSGHVVSSALAGVTGQVTGYAYNALRDVVLLGTADLAKNDTVRTAYHFWAVRVLNNGQHTSVTKLSSIANAAGQDNYAGWFKQTSLDGTHTYRLGFKEPKTSSTSGLGITDIRSKVASVSFHHVLPAKGFAWYQTFTVAPNGQFLSLAGPDGNPDGELSLLEWSLSTQPKTIAHLGDAHRTLNFGPLAEAVNGTTFGALVLQTSIVSKKLDRWALATVDTVSGAHSLQPLSPWTVGETDTPCGLGFQI